MTGYEKKVSSNYYQSYFFWCPEILDVSQITPELLFEKGISLEDNVKIYRYIIEKYDLPYKVCKYCAEVVGKENESKLCTVVKGWCSYEP